MLCENESERYEWILRNAVVGAYVCSLHGRSQQKCWQQGLPGPETPKFYSWEVADDMRWLSLQGFYKLRADISIVNLYRTHLGVIEVDDCAIVLDHVDLLNARDIVHWKYIVKAGWQTSLIGEKRVIFWYTFYCEIGQISLCQPELSLSSSIHF